MKERVKHDRCLSKGRRQDHRNGMKLFLGGTNLHSFMLRILIGEKEGLFRICYLFKLLPKPVCRVSMLGPPGEMGQQSHRSIQPLTRPIVKHLKRKGKEGASLRRTYRAQLIAECGSRGFPDEIYNLFYSSVSPLWRRSAPLGNSFALRRLILRRK